MKEQIIADEFTIISTQGLRFVERLDREWSSQKTEYRLRVTYARGNVLDFGYTSAALRDAQYSAIRAAVASPQSVAAVDPYASSTGKLSTREKDAL